MDINNFLEKGFVAICHISQYNAVYQNNYAFQVFKYSFLKKSKEHKIDRWLFKISSFDNVVEFYVGSPIPNSFIVQSM
jgi:hypothetical protein